MVALKEFHSGGYSHAEKLHVFLSDVLKEARLSFEDVDGIVVGKGPGSYTGLRIGVSAAKGLCFALDLPLIALETLSILAQSVRISKGCIVPMLDARRWEVYCAVFDPAHTQISDTEALVLDANSFADLLEKGPVYFVGDGAQKCGEIIRHPNAFFLDDVYPSAREMAVLSYEKFQNKEFEDVAYFEPFYLKDFVGTKSQKRG
jgi:tRNA threonylcarbamoyladenosine biosynthesis protein TsaB